MTAPNTPTPELEPIAWEDEWGELSRHKPSINPSPLYDAAAIARLTAERDAAEGRRDFWAADAVHSHERAEAAEKRVKKLEEESHRLQGKIEDYAEREGNALNDLDTALEANKLLSERVAVLETALEPFAKAARVLGRVAPDGIDDGLTVVAHIHVEPTAEHIFSTADFTRALAAREAK